MSLNSFTYKYYGQYFDGLNRDVWYLSMMMFVNRLGTLILPYLVLYTTQELDWNVVDAGKASMFFGFGSLAGAYLGGVLTKRYGYYRTMASSLLLAAISFWSLQYFSEFYILCGFLFISSMFADLIRPAVMTGVAIFTTKDTQTRAVSLLRMAFNLGLTVGPSIAGILIVKFGYKIIFMLDSITCFLALLFLFLFVENKSSQAKSEIEIDQKKGRSPWKDGPFMLFMFFNMIMLISFFQLLFTVPVFMNEVLLFTNDQIGIWYYGLNGFIIFILEMPLVYSVEKQISKFQALKIGAFLIGLGTLFLILKISPVFLLVLYVIFVSIGEIVNFPFIASISMDRAEKSTIGEFMGVNTMMFSLSLILAPRIGTLILDAYGYEILFSAMFGMTLVSILGLQLLQSKFQN